MELFEKQRRMNKPRLLLFCHGIHDIARTDDPEKGLGA
jgi:hypothetical protein